jgi:predicted RNase H-like nuclease
MRKITRVSCVVGVDGCHGGWLAIVERPGTALIADVFPTFSELFSAVNISARIAVDIPIGLPSEGSRECELTARQLLGRPRNSSVFPVPPRECLEARSYEEACRIRHRIEGKKISKQAYGILAKIREVDAFLDVNESARQCVAEVHPEVSFAAWNGGRPMEHGKKKSAGKAERRALIETTWRGDVDRLREYLRGQDYQLDDLHDAFAALWSARRWVMGEADVLGDPQALDAKGLPMRMVA